MYGERIFALLSGDAALAALVGSRIYPGKLPQGCAKPAIVYAVVSDVPVNSLDGHTSRLTNARVQCDVYSPEYGKAQQVADAVEDAFENSTSIQSWQVSRRDLYEDGTELHRVSIDHSLWGEE